MIRAEQDGDQEAVRAVNVTAFPTEAEADLVEALRQRASPIVSLVAVADDGIIGHILFSPVLLDSHPDARMMGLGPMAVTPGQQQRGVGSDLVRAGLEACKALGFEAVVVLGHPQYYLRFGFLPASGFGIRSAYDVPDDVFMAMELVPGGLDGKSGKVRYHEAFNEV